MNKRPIIAFISVIVRAIAAFVAYTAARIGREASNMDALLKADIAQRKTIDEARTQMKENGFTIDSDSPTLKGSGQKHSMIAFTTWLTVDVTSDSSGVVTSYHIDRASQ